MKTRKKLLKLTAIPTDYAGLVSMLPLRPIRDLIDAENATEIIDAMAGHELNVDQADYLDVLSDLLDRYESENDPVLTAAYTPLRRLRYLMEQVEMTTADLGRVLGNRPLATLILHGDRELSKTHMRKLGHHFGIDPGFFL